MAEISHRIFLQFIAQMNSYKFPKEIFRNYQLNMKRWKYKLNMTTEKCHNIKLFLSPLLGYFPGAHSSCAIDKQLWHSKFFNMPRLLNNVPSKYDYCRERNRKKRKRRRSEEEKKNKNIQLPSAPFSCSLGLVFEV